MKYLVINATQGKLVKETNSEAAACEAVEHYVKTFTKDTFYVAMLTQENVVTRSWQ